jgi:hypothetical protein
MKRQYAFAAAIVLTAFTATSLLAQSNSQIGTWKLNPAKSKFGPGQAPKSLTRTTAAQGNGAKTSFDGVASDGSKIGQ